MSDLVVKRKRHSALDFIEYLFVLMMIINANTIWTASEDNTLNRGLKLGVVAVGIIYIMVQKSLPSVAMKNILHSLVFGIIYILVYIAAVGYKPMGFIYLVCTVIAIYSFIQIANSRGRGPEIFFKYSKIIVIVAVISMIFWFFGSTLGIIQPTGTIRSTWVGSEYEFYNVIPSYYGVYFETQSEEPLFGEFDKMIRNTAIFTEAPMCNFNFCTALLIEMFYNPKPSRMKCGILITAILTTLSTTGYCMLAIALAAKFLTSSKRKEGLKFIKILSVPVVIILAILAFQYFLSNKLESGSGMSRARDFLVGLQAWSQSPIFGYGYGKPTYYLGIHYGYSNSIMPILGNGGLFLAIPYLYCIYQWCKTCWRERDIQKFLLFANFMFLFAITIMSYKYLTIYILFAYCVNRKAATATVTENVSPKRKRTRLAETSPNVAVAQ